VLEPWSNDQMKFPRIGSKPEARCFFDKSPRAPAASKRAAGESDEAEARSRHRSAPNLLCMSKVAKLEDAVEPSILRRPARAGAVFEKSCRSPDARRMNTKRRRRNIARRPQQKPGQNTTPRSRWWLAPLTTIAVAVVKALIEHWPWSK
jgi:hypothetical protein